MLHKVSDPEPSQTWREMSNKNALAYLEGDIFFHCLNSENYNPYNKEQRLIISYNYRLSLVSIGEVKMECEWSSLAQSEGQKWHSYLSFQVSHSIRYSVRGL